MIAETPEQGQRSHSCCHGAVVRSVLAVLMALAVMVPSAVAVAGDSAAADTLFSAGKKAMAQGDYALACAKFAASQKADPSVGALLNLARCRDKQGKTATAWGHYMEAAALAAKRKDDKRRKGGEEHAKRLFGLLSKLTIEVKHAVPDLVVKCNGRVVASNEFGTAVAVDPGPQVVTAEAPGHRSFRGQVTVAAERDRQTLVVPRLQSLTPARKPSPPVSSGMHPLAISGIVGMAVGGAALAAGAILGGLAIAKKGLITDPDCGDYPQCSAELSPEQFEQLNGFNASLKTLATTADILFVAGGVVAASGLVLFLVSPSSPAKPGGDRAATGPRSDGISIAVAPSFTSRDLGLQLVGSF